MMKRPLQTLFALAIIALWVLFSDNLSFGSTSDRYLVFFNNQLPSAQLKGQSSPQQLTNLRNHNHALIQRLQGWASQKAAALTVELELWATHGAVVRFSAEAAARLRAEPWVHSVERDVSRRYIHPVNTTAGNQPPNNGLWGLERIELEASRAAYPEILGSGVKVGILDTGWQSGHSEFAGLSGGEFRDFVNGLHFAYDDNGHGTHVAGTIAGVTTGIAPQAHLIVGKVFTAAGTAFDSMLLAGMQWMMDPDGDPTTADFPRVVNNSWGLVLPAGVVEVVAVDHLYRAVQAWVDHGIIPIFSAGNSGSRPNGAPAGFVDSIAVAAFDINDQLAEFSSRGPNFWRYWEPDRVVSVFKPDIAAPGVGVRSAMVPNAYSQLSGTSMAAPHVTGILALALQAMPEMSLADAKILLTMSAEPRMDLGFGQGIVNAKAALGLAHTKRRHLSFRD